MAESNELALQRAMEILGYEEFRSPEQERVIRSVMERYDVLGIMPTGGGKSAGYIVPTLALGLKTVVVSPLISLMGDQVMKLRQWHIPAYAVTGDTDKFEVIEAMFTMLGSPGRPAFLYASPEMLASEGFRKKFKHFKPDLIAIDEAHCVSTWGDTFRPSYLQIREIAQWFGSPQCVAFSATIDQKIEADVRARLPLKKDAIRVVASPFRENLTIAVETPGVHEKRTETRNRFARHRLLSLLQQEQSGAVIVYCYSRDRAAAEYEKVKDFARKRGYTPLLYHALVSVDDKERALDHFVNSDRPLVFCTSAFGMGVDRPDVRLVVHFDSPNTLVDYAQQIGRAGRDGLPARCVTFYDPRRVDRTDVQMQVSIPDVMFVERIYKRIVNAWRKAGGKLSLIGFQHQLEILTKDQLAAAEVYIPRAQRSIGLLKRAGYLQEKEGILTIKRLDRAASRYAKLLEFTQMSAKRQVRETDRIKRFFTDNHPNQELLWDIIGE
jgi:ATP-dependent DNA helicase RecQ